MKKSLLLQHYIELKQTFRLYFYRAKNGHDVEDIHQLRVNIKKFRAIWSLLGAISYKNPIMQQERDFISELFDAAGALREAQVNLKIIHKADRKKADRKALKPIVAYYNKIQKKSGKKLNRILRDFDQVTLELLDVQLQQEILVHTNEEILYKSIAYILKKIKKVNTIKQELPNINKLHKIRIHLKKVQEILSIIEEIYPKIKLSTIKPNIKKLNRRIGIWHDYTLLVPVLRKFEKKEKKKRRKKVLKGITKQIQKKQSNREDKIHRMLNTYLTSSQLKNLKKLKHIS